MAASLRILTYLLFTLQTKFSVKYIELYFRVVPGLFLDQVFGYCDGRCLQSSQETLRKIHFEGDPELPFINDPIIGGRKRNLPSP
jgi:hypothetical protein